MTLDTLFNMAKGTQDAGETVNDVYKVGEISRKTGLQKQQDGSWAPPKGADYQQAKKIHEGVTKTEAARQQAEKIHQGVLKTLSESKEDNAVVRAAKAESASEMAALRKKHDPVTGEGKSYRASKGGRTYAIKASSPEEAKEVLAKFGTKVSLKDIHEVGSSKSPSDDYRSSPKFKSAMERKAEYEKESPANYAIYTDGKGDFMAKPSGPENKADMERRGYKIVPGTDSKNKSYSYGAGSSNDAACDEKLYTPESVNGPREKLERQLTGDCKIRIRKETTEDAKRYNPGDISEKTGLQKQNDGSWAPVKKTVTNSTESSVKKSSIDTAHAEKDQLDKSLKGLSMPAMAEKLEDMDFKSKGVKQVNGTTMETFRKEYGNTVVVVSTWQKGSMVGSASKVFDKRLEETPTGVFHNMNVHGVIWSKGPTN